MTEAVRYRVSMSRPHSHLFEVEAQFPATDVLDLLLPVWTPGSYLVREFARHLEGVTATDPGGNRLPVERLDKHRFRVLAGGASAVTVRWKVYANELTVRTSHLDATHGFVSPAGVFLAVKGREGEPHRVAVALPPGWQAATALPGRFALTSFQFSSAGSLAKLAGSAPAGVQGPLARSRVFSQVASFRR